MDSHIQITAWRRVCQARVATASPAPRTPAALCRRWSSFVLDPPRKRPHAPCAARRMGRLVALIHAIVADHADHAQPVVVKHHLAPGLLRAAMCRQLPPPDHRRLILPERQRQELAGVGQALKPLDADKSGDRLGQGPHLGRHLQIWLLLSLTGDHLEYDRNHLTPSRLAAPFPLAACLG